MSSTDRNNCSISSFFSMSCADRTEAFARSLQSALSSLDSSGNGCAIEETGWLGNYQSSTAVSKQPRQASEASYEVNENFLESPNSPEEDPVVNLLINREDYLKNINGLKDNINSDLGNSPEAQKSTCDSYVGVTEELKISCNDISLSDITSSKSDIYSNDIEENKVTENNTKKSIDVITIVSQPSCEVCDESSQLSVSEESSKIKQSLLDVSINDIYDDDLENEQPTPRVRRCSSLKSGKTPPGTPGKKKFVKFADALGLELTNVRSFLDEIPKIPNSAFNDLKITDSTGNLNTTLNGSGSRPSERILCAMFQQPGGLPNFLDMVREKNINLENTMVEDPIDLSIRGTVRVRNLDFNKSVYVRYTLDGWKTHSDLQAVYVNNSCDGFSDKFSFLLYAHTLRIGQSLEFALRYHCSGCQFWDNNYGANYSFQCLPASKTVDDISMENYGNSWDPKFY